MGSISAAQRLLKHRNLCSRYQKGETYPQLLPLPLPLTSSRENSPAELPPSRLRARGQGFLSVLRTHHAFRDAQVNFSVCHPNCFVYFKVNVAVCSGPFREDWGRLIYFFLWVCYHQRMLMPTSYLRWRPDHLSWLPSGSLCLELKDSLTLLFSFWKLRTEKKKILN